MKISTKGRYALRALVDLAVTSKRTNSHVPLKDIAKRQGMSDKYLENLFSILKNSGIIGSKRGAQGGYYLMQKPGKITALEVIEAIEGPVAIVECCVSKRACNKRQQCKTITLWKKINSRVLEELQKTKLRDLM